MHNSPESVGKYIIDEDEYTILQQLKRLNGDQLKSLIQVVQELID